MQTPEPSITNYQLKQTLKRLQYKTTKLMLKLTYKSGKRLKYFNIKQLS